MLSRSILCSFVLLWSAISTMTACSSSKHSHQGQDQDVAESTTESAESTSQRLYNQASYSGWSGWIDTLSDDDVAVLDSIKSELTLYAKEVGTKYPGEFYRPTYTETDFSELTGYTDQIKLVNAYRLLTFTEIYDEYVVQMEQFMDEYAAQFMFGILTAEERKAKQMEYDAIKGLFIALSTSYYSDTSGLLTSYHTLALDLATDMHNYAFLIKDDVRGLAYNYTEGDYVLPCNLKQHIKRMREGNAKRLKLASTYIQLHSGEEQAKLKTLKTELKAMRGRWMGLADELATNPTYKTYASELKKLVKAKLRLTFPDQTNFGLCEVFSDDA